MENLEFILNVLKYLGLFLATSSSIWGATNIISKEIDGKKRLTRQGKISIILTIFGFLISITSNVIQDKYSSLKAQKAYLSEIKKTNRIILSGQPLLSLDFSINFPDIAKTNFKYFLSLTDSIVFENQAEASQGEMAGTQNLAIELASGLFPLMNASLKDTLPTYPSEFLLLISLDETQNSILSYGFLSDTSRVYTSINSDSNNNLLIKQKEKYSEGLILELPAYQVGAKEIAHPYFTHDSVSVNLNWNLDVKSLINCINKQNSDVSLNANLPNTLKIAVLYDFSFLPFSSGNVASCKDFNIWTEENTMEDIETTEDTKGSYKLKKHIYNNSSIKITPNLLTDQPVEYNFKSIYQKRINDPTWNEEFICNGLLIVYERADK